MITEDELSELLQRAGNAISVPVGAPETIRAAARRGASGGAGRRFTPLRRREVAFGGIGLAAIGALIGVLLTAGGTTVPAVLRPYGNVAAGTAQAPSSHAAVRSTPGAFGANGVVKLPAKSSGASPRSSARDIVATGALRLSVRSGALSGTVSNLESLASSYGGYVGSADVVESGRHLGGTLVLDVPASSFQSVIAHARAVGTVRSLTTSDNDVTGRVVDIGARLTALSDERSQLEVLLSKASKVSDLLQVENEIGFVQSEIEQLRGQQRLLDEQVAFSALSVRLAVPVVKHHKVAAASGFSRAWHVTISSFVDAVKGLVSALGDILFALLAALSLLALSWLSWRRGWPVLRRRLV